MILAFVAPSSCGASRRDLRRRPLAIAHVRQMGCIYTDHHAGRHGIGFRGPSSAQMKVTQEIDAFATLAFRR